LPSNSSRLVYQGELGAGRLDFEKMYRLLGGAATLQQVGIASRRSLSEYDRIPGLSER
jgi:hypothetical protein